MSRGGRWTVEAGRQLYFDGHPALGVTGDYAETGLPPTVADGATHLIADLFNRNGVTPDSIYTKHMGKPARKSFHKTSMRAAKPIPYDDDAPEEEGDDVWIDAPYSDAPFKAQHWYAGQGDPLYAIASSGFPQPKSTVEWALSNAEKSAREHDKHMVEKYGKRKWNRLVQIDPQSSAARKLDNEEREDIEASEEIMMLVEDLKEVLSSGEEISKAEGWSRQGKTR